MKRILVFAYGVVAYAIFFATFLYAVGFVGNLLVPKSMDSTPDTQFWWALIVDIVLLGIFRISAQHHGATGIQGTMDSYHARAGRA